MFKILAMGMAVLAASFAIASTAKPDPVEVDLDSGWTEERRQLWYEASQGSRLIPLDWLLALEQPGSIEPFLASDHIRQLRYIPRVTADGLPLPVGFAVDATFDEKLPLKLRWKAGQPADARWVGLNCSACHTAQITYGGKTLTVDGGPTLGDFQSLIERLDEALRETRYDTEKLDRFARKVLGPDDTVANRALLAKAMEEVIARQQQLAAMNATDVRYGYGRLDAVGHILNRTSWMANPLAPKANEPDAPVSYPFLWNVPQHNVVQWNGMAPSLRLPAAIGPGFDAGALARNTGEVMGVFASVAVKPNPVLGYASSVSIHNLSAFEDDLGALRPPKWPEAVLGPIDRAKYAAGKGLFEKQCKSCHAPLERTDLKTRFKASMTPLTKIGTDPWMACNTYLASAPTGMLEGIRTLQGRKLGPEAQVATMLEVAVTQVLLHEGKDIAKLGLTHAFGIKNKPVVTPPFKIRDRLFSILGVGPPPPEREERLRDCLKGEQEEAKESKKTIAYKGRPLNGVWATAPYLHNGSVPTLNDLLLPPAQRPPSFYVGSREFDPKNVGFVTGPSPDNSFVFKAFDADGTPAPGNSNLGHDYGNADLDVDEREALIEYMKGL